MTVATMDGDAGLWLRRGVGRAALVIVVTSSFRHTGHTSVSWKYWTRSTFAGVIRSSSRPNCQPRCSIGAPQSGQLRPPAGTGMSTLRTGSAS